MHHDVKHEEKQNAALRFLAREIGPAALAEVDLLLGPDEKPSEDYPVDVAPVSAKDSS